MSIFSNALMVNSTWTKWRKRCGCRGHVEAICVRDDSEHRKRDIWGESFLFYDTDFAPTFLRKLVPIDGQS